MSADTPLGDENPGRLLDDIHQSITWQDTKEGFPQELRSRWLETKSSHVPWGDSNCSESCKAWGARKLTSHSNCSPPPISTDWSLNLGWQVRAHLLETPLAQALLQLGPLWCSWKWLLGVLHQSQYWLGFLTSFSWPSPSPFYVPVILQNPPELSLLYPDTCLVYTGV
ncbi:hypothetical protein DSO57_1006706 [Entomophthora muscae]|uniref:Uncharacterized protein n=1 Tax=Entomophthora muscae TaxID=34485 RepID=A0ACC2UH93_9FUNG|nr:hypothetical protein DSO57_1006706 [Entomophthora muscae]